MERPRKRARESPSEWASYLMILDRDTRFEVAKQLDLPDVWAMCHINRSFFEWCNSYDLYNLLFREWYGVDEWRKTRAFFAAEFVRVNPLWMLIGYYMYISIKNSRSWKTVFYFGNNESTDVIIRSLTWRSKKQYRLEFNFHNLTQKQWKQIVHHAMFLKHYEKISTKPLLLLLPRDGFQQILNLESQKMFPFESFLLTVIYLVLKYGMEWLHVVDNGEDEEIIPIRSQLCATCNTSKKLQLCGGCQQVAYCSTECQRVDWVAGHAHRCIHNHYRPGDCDYVDNIEYRTLHTQTQGPNVVYNDPSGHVQVATMAIPVGGKAAAETHTDLTQFIRVESGHGEIELGGRTYGLGDGESAVVPAGVEHEIRNTGQKALKLYTLYAKDQAAEFAH